MLAIQCFLYLKRIIDPWESVDYYSISILVAKTFRRLAAVIFDPQSQFC